MKCIICGKEIHDGEIICSSFRCMEELSFRFRVVHSKKETKDYMAMNYWSMTHLGDELPQPKERT